MMSTVTGKKISDLRSVNSLTDVLWFEVIRRIGTETPEVYENRRISLDLLRELTGKDGKSAYEVAVALGFSGSESEWLSSLVGPQGPKGDKGQEGTNGRDGVDGNDGESAYQIDVRVNGYDGSEEEWLAEVKQGGTPYDFQADLGTSVDTWRNIIRDVIDAFDTTANGLLVKGPDGVDFKAGTKDMVGLGNVDNTSDVNKPLSNAMIAALGDKVSRSTVDTLLTTYVKIADIVDRLDSTDTDAPLSANQGRVLKEAIDALSGIFGDNEPTQEFYDAIQMILNGEIPISGVSGLRNELDGLAGRVAALEGDSESGDNANAISDLQTRIAALEANGGSGVDLTQINSEIDAIKVRLDTLETGSGDTGGTAPDVTQELNDLSDRITSLETSITNKVDKVVGKQLSTNDFTDVYRTKLDGLSETGSGGSNYTHPTGFASNSSGPLTGNRVISRIQVNDEGHVTGTEERDLTAGDLGAAQENHNHDGRYYTRAEVDQMIADAGAGGDTGGGSSGGVTMVRKRFEIMRGSFQAIVIVVGFGSQAAMDLVTCQELDGGGKVRIDNVTDGLILHSVMIFYDDGWNSTTSFRLEYPDNWGDSFMGDMVYPMMMYYSRSNPPTIQPMTNISVVHENGFNVVARPGLIADRGYHFKYLLT
tara:strand:- start:315 stop:2261 length:1947 start_codon:yes stop_codon:yes gene_type:complete